MASIIRATLYALLFLAFAASTFATPSPLDITNLATADNTSLDERSTLLAGSESVVQVDALEKRGRRRKHRKPRRKPGKQGGGKKPVKGNNRSAKGVRHSGDATFYTVGMGACGHENSDSDMIAAASHELYDSFPGATANPNDNPICGRRLKATYRERSVVVQIVDRCAGCAEWALDFSPKAFNKLGKPQDGRLHDMTWEWV